MSLIDKLKEAHVVHTKVWVVESRGQGGWALEAVFLGEDAACAYAHEMHQGLGVGFQCLRVSAFAGGERGRVITGEELLES